MIDFDEELFKKVDVLPKEEGKELIHATMLRNISYLGASVGEWDNISIPDYANAISIIQSKSEKRDQ